MIVNHPMKTIVLVVEDQPDIRKLVSMTLDFGDYEIHEAETGQGALHMVRALRPDVVLLDAATAGDEDGSRECEKNKQTRELSATLVVMWTAQGQPTDVEAGSRAGCDAYLAKPFSPLELIDTVERLLESRGRRNGPAA